LGRIRLVDIWENGYQIEGLVLEGLPEGEWRFIHRGARWRITFHGGRQVGFAHYEYRAGLSLDDGVSVSLGKNVWTAGELVQDFTHNGGVPLPLKSDIREVEIDVWAGHLSYLEKKQYRKESYSFSYNPPGEHLTVGELTEFRCFRPGLVVFPFLSDVAFNHFSYICRVVENLLRESRESGTGGEFW
jgi:hypothetical protein